MNQIKYGAVLSYVSLGFSTLSGIFYTPYLLRKLGQTEFGLYSLAASVIAYLVLLDFGFHGSIVRFAAKLRAENKNREQYEMFGMFWVIYCALALLVAVAGFFIVTNVESLLDVKTMTPEQIFRAKIIICILLGNLCFNFPMSIFSAIVVAYERFIFFKSISILRMILQIAVMILLLMWGYKAIALAVLLTTLNVLTLFVNMIYCFLKLKIRIYFTNFDLSLLKEISIFSFFTLFFSLMNNIFWSSGQLILGHTSGLDATAVYAVAVSLVGFYISVSCCIPGLFLPRLVGMLTQNDAEKNISDLFIKVGRLQFYIVGTIFAGFVIYGKFFVGWWAGAGYEQVYVVTVILMLAQFPPLIQNIGLEVLKAKNQLGFCFVMYFVFAFIGLIISFLGAKYFGVIGCAAGTFFALIFGQGVAVNVYFWKKIHINVPAFWRQIMKLSLPVLIISVAFFILEKYCASDSFMWWACRGAFYLLVVFVGYYGFAMNKFEKNLFHSLLQKIRW